MLCGLLTIVGFLLWSGYTLVKQSREIDTFTADAPEAIIPADATGAERDALVAKLTALKNAVTAREPLEISLDTGELNTLLSLQPFSEVRGLIRADKIEGGLIHARISFILNALPPGSVRYLNGTLLCKPAVNAGAGLVMHTEDIQVPGKTVAEGFLRRYRQDGYLDTMLVQEFRDDDQNGAIAAVLKAITAVEIAGDRVLIRYQPGQEGQTPE